MNFSELGWSDELCNNNDANINFIALQESEAGARARAFLLRQHDPDIEWDDPELLRLGAPLVFALYRFSQSMPSTKEAERADLLEYADEAIAVARKYPDLV